MLGSIISLQTTISSWVRSPAHWKIRTQEVITRLSDITQGSQFPYWLGQQVKTISATNACMCFMALIAAMVTIHYCQCQCVWYLSYSLLLDLRAEEIRVLRHLVPPRCSEKSKKPCSLSWDRTQAIGALAHGFTRRATGAPLRQIRRKWLWGA